MQATDQAKKEPVDSPLEVIKVAVRDFGRDDCSRYAAALAYYTVFSLPGVLVLILLLLGIFVQPETVQGALQGQISNIIGADAAADVEAIIANAMDTTAGGLWTKIVGIAVLTWGATKAFAALQDALNVAWEVQPQRSGVKGFLVKRGMSFLMILVIGLVFLAALVMSTVIAAAGGLISELLGGAISEPLLFVLNIGLSLAIFTLLFASIFKILPDVEIGWNNVWLGAFGTAVLFEIARFGLGLWLGRSSPGSVYGAAASLIVLLLWIHISSMILLFGAELTQAWVRYKGHVIKPSSGAVKVHQKTIPVDQPAGAT